MAKETSEKAEKTKVKCCKCNPYLIGAGIIVLLIIAYLLFGGVITGKASKGQVGEKTVEFLNSYFTENGATGEVELIDVEEDSGLYKINMLYNSEEMSVYVTKDGKYIIPSQALSPLSSEEQIEQTEEQTTEIAKSDKPKVELFVMSHCPYGTQAEKGIIPAIELLKDKIDFELKFVYYAMHGETEVKEELNQYCIQKEQNDKFLTYLKCFLKEGNGESCLSEAKIDKAKLTSCTEKADAEFDITKNFEDESTYLSGRFPLFNINKEDNEKYSVGGSPTLIINGVQAESGRDSASYLNAICSAFNTAPEECSEKLSSTAYQAGFGYDEGSASEASCG